ncbi:glucose PTS transporter transcription antiterminator GlcT [Caldalkalibacillus mannanilyticus]|uniref:glucose PTS transporter transcription antiterminator GlcT n=1 Tax=Caldalkalibacillus mannanilyticus TaxID=1418 RepID=UPI00046A45A8|nr:transcription antiterminator [Caldalkalibacillus mannanilyticus]
METYTVVKALNNNVIIAHHPTYQEVVLIGKGIGFEKKKNDQIESAIIEKLFILKDEHEQSNYKKLLDHIDEGFIETMNDLIFYIQSKIPTRLNEHIHLALTDHIAFALRRMEQGLDIKNPFIVETKALYPLEYRIAKEVTEILNQKLAVSLPEGEVGFIALHIHSAITSKRISEVNLHSQLISKLIDLIEQTLFIVIDPDSIHYLRLIRHLQHAIERVIAGEEVEEPHMLTEVLREEYPLCYNLSWKLIKIMQQTLKKPVCHAEACYLTMHLQRLTKKIK